jgi:hypothetical protein
MKSMRSAPAVIVLLLSGCAVPMPTPQPWSYPPPEPPAYTVARSRPEAVVVYLAEDLRRTDVFDETGWAIGPLVPCGWITYERPETARGADEMFPTQNDPKAVRFFAMNPARDLPTAVAAELRRTNLFPNAEFRADRVGGKGAWTLSVTINRFAWTVANWTYGLSVFGGIPAYFGAPYAHSLVRIDLDLVLRDPAGAPVWTGKVAGDLRKEHRLYHHFGFDVRDFARLPARELAGAIAAMDKSLGGGGDTPVAARPKGH